jgi:UDP-N-acetylmuramoylalanine--D-glutamate ligase
MFSLEGPADAWLDGERLVIDNETIIRRPDMALAGLHNVSNALASTLAALELGGSVRAAGSVLGGFAGLDHRHLTIHEADGVCWVDDSKATNIGAALAALRGYPNRSVHLILGGLSKGQDFSLMVPEVQRAVVRVYLIGIDGPAIARALEGSAELVDCGTLDEAVRRARSAAREGQWVVLAPACASFDQFSDYSERGRAFAELARQEVGSCQ